MENEFDPTLTERAQNSYAEGMQEPHSPEQDDTTADAEEAPKTKPQERDTVREQPQTPEQVQESRQKRREAVERAEKQDLRKRINEERLVLERWKDSGRIDEEMYREHLRELDRKLGDTGFGRLDAYKELLDRGIDEDGNVEQQLLVKNEVFREMQKIARNYLQNPNRQLRLTPQEQEIVQQLSDANPSQMSMDRMRDLINQINRRDLLKDMYADNALTRFVEEDAGPTGESREQREAYLDQYYPPSAEDLAENLTMMEGDEWQTGGPKEIIMKDGTIHWGNMLEWARERWLKWGHQFNPDDPQASAWRTVGFLSGMSFIDLQSWVLQDRYWRKKVVKLDANGMPMHDADDKLIYERGANGKIKYETSPEYENFRQCFLNEMFRFSKAHEHDVMVRKNRGNEEEMMKQLGAVMDQTIWMKDRDGLIAMWKLSASNEVIKEGDSDYDPRYKGMFRWMLVEGSNGPIEEGNLGKAHRQADYLYFKMAHIENVGDQDNAFHEGLGEKGRMEFYRSMVQRNLKRMYGSDTTVKDVLDKVKGAGLEGIDLTEIMFCKNEADMRALMTKQSHIDDATLEKFLNKGKPQSERIYKQLSEADFQAAKDAFLKGLIQESVQMRTRLLEKLTGIGTDGRRLTGESGHIAFRSKDVWDLFNSMRGNSDQTLAEIKAGRDWTKMQHLGLRFMDLIVPDPPGQQGDKWNTKPEDARKEVQKALNLFKRGFNSAPWISTVRGAIQDAVGEVNNLPGFDAEYAENFAYSKVYFMLSSGLNDTTATGTDASTKLLQFMGYRLNNLLTGGGKNFVGSIQNLRGVKRLLLTPWEGLYGEQTDAATGKKKKISLAKVLEHGFTEETRGKKLLEVDAAQGVEVTYAANHVSSALKLFKRYLKGPIFDFEKWIKIDLYNRVTIDPGAMNEIMNGINKDIRYTFNQIGIDFEEIDDDAFEIDFTREPGKTTYGPKLTFSRKKMKDKLFDKEVINMGMYDRRIFEGRWANGQVGQRDKNGEDMLKEYSRNVFFYLVAKDMLEHRLYDPEDSMYNSSIWGRTMVNAVEGLFASVPIELETTTIGLFNKHTKIRKRDSFANRKEFDKIRKMANAGRFQLLAEDIRAQVAESAWKGGPSTTKRFFSYIFQDLWTFK